MHIGINIYQIYCHLLHIINTIIMQIGIHETALAGPGDCHIKGGYIEGRQHNHYIYI